MTWDSKLDTLIWNGGILSRSLIIVPNAHLFLFRISSYDVSVCPPLLTNSSWICFPHCLLSSLSLPSFSYPTNQNSVFLCLSLFLLPTQLSDQLDHPLQASHPDILNPPVNNVPPTSAPFALWHVSYAFTKNRPMFSEHTLCLPSPKAMFLWWHIRMFSAKNGTKSQLTLVQSFWDLCIVSPKNSFQKLWGTLKLVLFPGSELPPQSHCLRKFYSFFRKHRTFLNPHCCHLHASHLLTSCIIVSVCSLSLLALSVSVGEELRHVSAFSATRSYKKRCSLKTFWSEIATVITLNHTCFPGKSGHVIYLGFGKNICKSKYS